MGFEPAGFGGRLGGSFAKQPGTRFAGRLLVFDRLVARCLGDTDKDGLPELWSLPSQVK